MKNTKKKAYLTLINSLLNSSSSQVNSILNANHINPLESSLVLANRQRITLADITSCTMRDCFLVTLSACESGLTDINKVTDDYVGLPSGFLISGVKTVVSSLWLVNDLSTALLMIRFYENLINSQSTSPQSVSIALNQAQLWLRDATKIQLEEWITEYQLNSNPTLRNQLRRRFHNMPDDEQPFHSPFYWAAFCAIG
ncbi:CHAT domain-containing protein [Okeanomitos corallinicola TIOX110]|uniref:CHAT domain-containing protein n=1 Tax=Okeanomitos corallinicola TIOX110 TaxID=3133117 RepID=A0ABZ2UV88_9CYAN